MSTMYTKLFLYSLLPGLAIYKPYM